jgi:hypothetical protein
MIDTCIRWTTPVRNSDTESRESAQGLHTLDIKVTRAKVVAPALDFDHNRS